ncbi:MAG: hypothetical protein ACD_9C00051G0014 [uncultured bacterium]|nr:MAG: hypothetical protein ACD_9C00051G0014 [uncultured bacterium]
MTTINLYQKHKDSGEGTALNKSGNSGFIFSLSILIITVVVAVGLKIYIPSAENKNEALSKRVEAESSSLVGLKKLEQISDTKKRLAEISSNLEIKNDKAERMEVSQTLNNLAADMIKGSYISQYTYTDGKVVVKMMSNNFNSVAKQILNLKKTTYFSDVNVLKVSRGEESVEFDVEMKIKK